MNLHYYNEENALNRLNPATSINTAAAEVNMANYPRGQLIIYIDHRAKLYMKLDG